jgi:hypothetical protein
MMRKHKITALFLTISLIFAILSLPNSSAISSGRLERGATADVVSDSAAVLKLEGLSGQNIYNIDKDYDRIGSITNNTNQSINLTVDITPDLIYVISNYKLNVKIGNKVTEFKKNKDSTQSVTISLAPRQAVDIQASLHNNLLGWVNTSFRFTAEDISGTYSMQLNDTQRTPRRFTCY